MIEERTMLVFICDLCKDEYVPVFAEDKQRIIKHLTTRCGWVCTNKETNTFVCDECADTYEEIWDNAVDTSVDNL